jgi:hypothetical protein
LNASGGNERTRFFLSGGYFQQEGIDLGSELKRYTTRINIDHTANKLAIQLNAAAVTQKPTILKVSGWVIAQEALSR